MAIKVKIPKYRLLDFPASLLSAEKSARFPLARMHFRYEEDPENGGFVYMEVTHYEIVYVMRFPLVISGWDKEISNFLFPFKSVLEWLNKLDNDEVNVELSFILGSKVQKVESIVRYLSDSQYAIYQSLGGAEKRDSPKKVKFDVTFPECKLKVQTIGKGKSQITVNGTEFENATSLFLLTNPGNKLAQFPISGKIFHEAEMDDSDLGLSYKDQRFSVETGNSYIRYVASALLHESINVKDFSQIGLCNSGFLSLVRDQVYAMTIYEKVVVFSDLTNIEIRILTSYRDNFAPEYFYADARKNPCEIVVTKDILSIIKAFLKITTGGIEIVTFFTRNGFLYIGYIENEFICSVRQLCPFDKPEFTNMTVQTKNLRQVTSRFTNGFTILYKSNDTPVVFVESDNSITREIFLGLILPDGISIEPFYELSEEICAI